MLKNVMLQVRTQHCVPLLEEKDESLFTGFEMVIEKLTINPLQLDSIEYLRLLAESLEKFSDILRKLSISVSISDWLLRYQLQLLKIFDTIEFCLSEEQFIVIGSKEKYTRTSTQDAIHAVKQLITHYKITSTTNEQRKSEPSHIKVLAARQGLTESAEPSSRTASKPSQRASSDARQHRADTIKRHATRSPLGIRDDPPRSSSRCSLGALPSKRGPSFAVYLKNVFIERDHGFKLLCVVLDSEIDVRWTKDGADIVQTGRYQMRQKNGLITLQVDHAEYEDTGVFACHVFNNYGQSFNKCTVEVYDTSDDVICSSFSIPHKTEYQQASTNHYTDKSCATNTSVSPYAHQRTSVRSSCSDHTKAKEYYRRQYHAEQRGYTRDNKFGSSQELRRSARSTSTYHSPYHYASSQGLAHSSHFGESTTTDVSISRQRRSYYHERLMSGAATQHDRTSKDLRKSPIVLEQQSTLSEERAERLGREWTRKRTSPAVGRDAQDDGGSSRHTLGRGVAQASNTTSESSLSRDESKTLRSSERSQVQTEHKTEVHSAELERSSGRRSQTFPYHYRMDTFATSMRYESLSSLQMYQPIVQTVLRDRMVKRGSNLILVCSFWGVNCEIEWIHNYAKISNGAKYRISRHQGMSILEIYDITNHEAGMYKCVVRNDCGEDVTNCCILVLDHIRLSSMKHMRPERHSLTRRY
ncbi:uncharacterized protein LOC128732059 [Anopheles nili]|uniref:uncharacterized protein LOC128732059 n=1 Tax=Anopheles nili TaxID=185578 RepID=UPI00237B1B96|nr:uncharacterized protein LOC128732059 [Anopheles nili]